ncbi:hypothetical protein V1294_006030 [Bradyrhizobium sp. AZCC 1678]|uniref:hypothetical protein n=1 Tax=Bradyrhizobium sp. AZCC 1678 TaxID=3117030 RepID=UPI002FF289FB
MSKLAEMFFFSLDLQDSHQIGRVSYPVCDAADRLGSPLAFLAIGSVQCCGSTLPNTSRSEIPQQ